MKFMHHMHTPQNHIDALLMTAVVVVSWHVGGLPVHSSLPDSGQLLTSSPSRTNDCPPVQE